VVRVAPPGKQANVTDRGTRFVSLVSREIVGELGLEPGMLAVAAVKATNISVTIPKTDRQDR
jgi:molybdopterin-binding protein